MWKHLLNVLLSSNPYAAHCCSCPEMVGQLAGLNPPPAAEFGTHESYISPLRTNGSRQRSPASVSRCTTLYGSDVAPVMLIGLAHCANVPFATKQPNMPSPFKQPPASWSAHRLPDKFKKRIKSNTSFQLHITQSQLQSYMPEFSTV